MRWEEHAVDMGEIRKLFSILVENPEGKDYYCCISECLFECFDLRHYGSQMINISRREAQY
jgi:hypothetical protein